MHLHISTLDGVPVYLQIVQQIKHLVASGRLTAGEELPPIRVLAERLVINPNTVARAYRELESSGVVVKRGTAGTYVADGDSARGAADRHELITGRIDALLVESRQLQISLEELLDLVRLRDQAMQPQI